MSTEEKLKHILAVKLGLDDADLLDSARIDDDLGMDSMDSMDFLNDVEGEFGEFYKEIPDDKIDEVFAPGSTVAQVIERIKVYLEG